MAAATNPGNIGHAWVKSLWIDRQPASGMENPDAYDPADYDFIPARVSDNPIYAGDEKYLKTLRALPSHFRRAFLDGDWDVFAGQYFDKFDHARHVARAEQIDWKPWWPRWISIDWGFEHPSAAYWHAALPHALLTGATPGAPPSGATGVARGSSSVGAWHAMHGADSWRDAAHSATTPVECGGSPPLCSVTTSSDDNARPQLPSPPESGSKLPHSTSNLPSSRVVTYREYVTHRTPPRELARQIVERSKLSGLLGQGAGEGNADREHIDAIYLSPDAFARRTDEASIADQMGDVFAAAGFPRPVPADNDRVGGWMLMYQMLEAGEWLLTDNCIELIRTLPNLVRDPARIEDVEKMDGDDPADAARYGLKSRYAARHGGSSDRRMPLAARLAERVTSADPTVRAIQARKAQLEESHRTQPVSFLHRRR